MLVLKEDEKKGAVQVGGANIWLGGVAANLETSQELFRITQVGDGEANQN